MYFGFSNIFTYKILCFYPKIARCVYGKSESSSGLLFVVKKEEQPEN
jgi:cyanate permease